MTDYLAAALERNRIAAEKARAAREAKPKHRGAPWRPDREPAKRGRSVYRTCKALSDAEDDRIVALFREGHKQNVIAQMVGRSTGTVFSALVRLGVHKPKAYK